MVVTFIRKLNLTHTFKEGRRWLLFAGHRRASAFPFFLQPAFHVQKSLYNGYVYHYWISLQIKALLTIIGSSAANNIVI